jgi:F-type H+-transporting ATPase subunit O
MSENEVEVVLVRTAIFNMPGGSSAVLIDKEINFLFKLTIFVFFFIPEKLQKMLSAFSRSTSTALRRVAVKSFATEAAHRPVIGLHGLHARYANATYVAASKSGILEQVEGELAALAKSASSSPAFSSFLENPLIPRDEKSKQIAALLAGSKVSSITVNLCTTLAGNARLNELNKVATTYAQLMKAKRGQVDATIISAEALTQKQSDQIAAAIKATNKDAKEVLISSKVDPAIIGGIQVQIGDQFLDLSVKSRIEEIARTPI